MITHIIWDYNGTVVDDVDTSVAAVNEMLRRRGLSQTDKLTYVNTLVMPLENYYKSVGICNESINTLSVEFQQLCNKYSKLSSIFEGVFDVITAARQLNITNILMSSLYNEYLISEVKRYKINDWFDEIIGMTDTSVKSKLSNAKNYLASNKINPQNVLFIGDLTSDAEMAKAVGADCILIPNGHNSKVRCQSQGVKVYDNIKDVKQYLFKK